MDIKKKKSLSQYLFRGKKHLVDVQIVFNATDDILNERMTLSDNPGVPRLKENIFRRAVYRL